MSIPLNSAAGKLVVAHLAKQKGGAREPKAKKPAKAKGGAQSVRTGGPLVWRFVLTVPVRVVSEANLRENWRTANRRKRQQQEAVRDLWAFTPLPMWGGNWTTAGPVNVILTHFGPTMDDDNLRLKGANDGRQEDDRGGIPEGRYSVCVHPRMGVVPPVRFETVGGRVPRSRVDARPRTRGAAGRGRTEAQREEAHRGAVRMAWGVPSVEYPNLRVDP
jgi:hypothetical protein